ncbi:MAG: hypothetical protein WBL48_02650, partial [Pseudolabrys sp.]
GKTYFVSYVYNLADKVTKITYPSGRIVDVSRDPTGRVGGVTTKKNAAAASAVLPDRAVCRLPVAATNDRCPKGQYRRHHAGSAGTAPSRRTQYRTMSAIACRSVYSGFEPLLR